MQVPAEWIVGTRAASRANAFARNFMPLLAPHTEFGMKWGELCESHVEEGIRDNVKVYEYMNRYYVQEGNKRVSVLMGDKVEPRKEWIEENVEFSLEDDYKIKKSYLLCLTGFLKKSL